MHAERRQEGTGPSLVEKQHEKGCEKESLLHDGHKGSLCGIMVSVHCILLGATIPIRPV